MTVSEATGPARGTLAPVTKDARFEPVPGWGLLPHGVTFRNDATSVAIDGEDNVFVFNRGPTPVIVFDRDGRYLDGWGQGEFDRPHGAEIDAEGNLFLADDGGHFVQKRSPEGRVMFTLGERGHPAAKQSGEMFNRPTDVAVHPVTGELFVSDGYGNSRVHKFDPSGKHMLSWGEPGTGPGQFSLPHNICVYGGDRVAVCDRENFRVQFFTLDGEYVEEWHVHHPMSVKQGVGGDGSLYVGEMGPPPVQQGVRNLGNCVSIYSSSGEQLQRLGAPLPGSGPDEFVAPHGIAVDSEGSIYVGEVAWTFWYSKQPNPPVGEVPSIRKWRRVA